MAFSGFTRDTLFTPVPNPLFGGLLEDIQDLAELKVTLRGLWLFHRKRTGTRALYRNEFLSDVSLLRGLKGLGKDAKEEIRRGLELAVARGTFLLHRPGESEAASTERDQVYFLNDATGRRSLSRLRSAGNLAGNLAGNPDESAEPPDEQSFDGRDEEEVRDDASNIFSLYENNVGTLSPLLADQLKEAEEAYPWPWIVDAFRIAALENKRSWRYIAGILRRWAAEGKDAGKDYGKLGRHPKKDNRQKYLEDYQRRWSSPPVERT